MKFLNEETKSLFVQIG